MASGRDAFGNLLPHEHSSDTHVCDVSGCREAAVAWYERSDWSCGGPTQAPRVFGRCAGHAPPPGDLVEQDRGTWVRPALCRPAPEPERAVQHFVEY